MRALTIKYHEDVDIKSQVSGAVVTEGDKGINIKGIMMMLTLN